MTFVSTNQSSSQTSLTLLKWIAASALVGAGIVLIAKPVAQTDFSSSKQPDTWTEESEQPHPISITRLFPTPAHRAPDSFTSNTSSETASPPDRPIAVGSASTSPRLQVRSLTAFPQVGVSVPSPTASGRSQPAQGRSPGYPSRASSRSIALAPPQLPLPQEADVFTATRLTLEPVGPIVQSPVLPQPAPPLERVPRSTTPAAPPVSVPPIAIVPPTQPTGEISPSPLSGASLSLLTPPTPAVPPAIAIPVIPPIVPPISQPTQWEPSSPSLDFPLLEPNDWSLLPSIEEAPSMQSQPEDRPGATATALPQASSDVESLPDQVFVERFNVVGSTVFSPTALAEVARQAVLLSDTEVSSLDVNRTLSLMEIVQAGQSITRQYVDQGYISSGAYVTQDQIHDGVVTIQVVEGSLEDINIQRSQPAPGSLLDRPIALLPGFNPDLGIDPQPSEGRLFITGYRPLNLNYVRDRLAIAGSAPFNVNRLLAGVQLLQLDPLIQSIATEIVQGTNTGTSILNVRVSEANTSDIQIQADNNRSPSVGSFQQRVQLSQASLLGWGDRLVVGYNRTEGSHGWDASYILPINARNGTLSLSYSNSSSEVIEDPFNFLDIQSASRSYELTFRQPIFQNPTEEIALSLTASRRESESKFLEALIGESEPFPSAGTDENGNSRISAIRFAQEWLRRESRQVLSLRSEFSLGLDALNSTINPIRPDSRFFSWRGQGQWIRQLGKDGLFLLRGDLQLADGPLVPTEQFGLGGQGTIRGYRQDTLLTDNGWLASAELRLPILRVPEINGVLQVAPFLEIGWGWNTREPDPSPNTLASVGLGLLWQQSDRLSARLYWGIPLTDVSSSGRTLQEDGIHFSVMFSPF